MTSKNEDEILEMKGELEDAIDNEDEEKMREILQENPFLLNTGINSGYEDSPLVYACKRNDIRLAKSLLSFPAINVNFQSEVRSLFPIH